MEQKQELMEQKQKLMEQKQELKEQSKTLEVHDSTMYNDYSPIRQTGKYSIIYPMKKPNNINTLSDTEVLFSGNTNPQFRLKSPSSQIDTGIIAKQVKDSALILTVI